MSAVAAGWCAVLTLLVALIAAPSAAGASARAQQSAPVAIRIDSISPLVPRAAYAMHRLRIRLTVQNLTTQPLENVQIDAIRGGRIQSATDLTKAIAHPSTTGVAPVTPVHPVTVSIGPVGSASAAVTTRFVTTVGLPTSAGFCLCDTNAVLPLVLFARASSGATLGSAEAFIPSFVPRPPPVHVSWVWPLIDRPHRLTRSTDFLDDDLASSITTGRLQRCLQVLQQIAPRVPVTIVIDPELLDELEIMATTHYRYFDAAGKLVPGTGSAAAQEWLAGLQAVLQNNPQVSVALTPQDDPDVESLARAGLSWSAALSPAVTQRVATALGGVVPTTGFAWPPSGVVGHGALAALSGSGYTSLLLSSQSLRQTVGPAGLPVTLARLHNGGRPVVAAVTSPTLQSAAAAAVSSGGSGANLSRLMAEIAVRLAQRPKLAGQNVVLTPPRYVDPDVSSAVATVLQTSSSQLTQPASLTDVLAGAATAPFDQEPRTVPDRIAPPTSSNLSPQLPPADVRIARHVVTVLASLKSLFGSNPAALQRLAQLSDGVQRIESAAWRPGTVIGGRAEGAALARILRTQVHALVAGVHIITRSSAHYTLASTNSPLLITVENDLDYPVHIRVAVRTVKGIPGLDAGAVGPQLVQPHSKSTLHVPTQVQRSGRIQVRAFLLTPDGRPLGAPVTLTVNSTALGVIGVVITIVSGAVLALALLVRLLRRLRARRNRPPGSNRPWLPEPDPVPTAPAAATPPELPGGSPSPGMMRT